MVADTSARVHDAIDCDVHCLPETLQDLFPYLEDEYWQQYINTMRGGGRSTTMDGGYPPGMPTSATPAARAAGGPLTAATYEQLKARFLDVAEPQRAILNCTRFFQATRNPYYTIATSRALNDWLIHDWLDRDDRLLASLVVPIGDVDGAITEIERHGSDPRFVQVLLPIRTAVPYGNKQYDRMLAAIERHGLAIGLHAWGQAARAPTPSGYVNTYLQDYAANWQIVQIHVLSLVAEGVFERYPGLRVSVMECGFNWLPSLLWRFDKDWKGLWREVPWLKDKPSTYVRRHFKATTEPAQLPRDDRQARELLKLVGSDMLMYASDHPHDHGPSGARLLELLEDDAAEAVLRSNAASFYRLEARVPHETAETEAR
jgi:predicted TIM-barrel fold metal-dependent hydrolase